MKTTSILITAGLLLLASCQRVDHAGDTVVWRGARDGATVSPDGRTVAYVDWDTGHLGLYRPADQSFARGSEQGGLEWKRELGGVGTCFFA